MTQNYIEGLLAEREQYIVRKLDDRIRQVEDQLVALGWGGVLLSSSSAPSESGTPAPKKPSQKRRTS